MSVFSKRVQETSCGGSNAAADKHFAPASELGDSAYDLLIEERQLPSISTGINELDRVLAGTTRRWEASDDREDQSEEETEKTTEERQKRVQRGKERDGPVAEEDVIDNSYNRESVTAIPSAAETQGICCCDGVYEITGEAGSGKTQFAIQLSVMALLPSHDGSERKVIFLDTVGSFFPERFLDIAETQLGAWKKRHPNTLLQPSSVQTSAGDLLQRLEVLRVYDHNEVLDLLHSYVLPLCDKYALVDDNAARRRPTRLLVIDSLSALYRHAYNQRLSIRAADLLDLGNCLHCISRSFAVIITNDLTTKFSPTPHLAPSLGSSWAAVPRVRIWLEKSDSCHLAGRRLAKVLKNRRGTLVWMSTISRMQMYPRQQERSRGDAIF